MASSTVLHEAIAYLADSLHQAFPDVKPGHTDEGHNEVVVKWYLSPTQHVVEMIGFHAILLPLLWWLSKQQWSVEVPALPPKVSSCDVWKNSNTDAIELAYTRGRRKGGALLRYLDHLLCLIAWVCGFATVWYKTQNGREAYLLQPCHIQNFVIMYLTLDGTSAFATYLFHFYICTSYGTLLALATPDLRGLGLPFEVESFFLQHVMLIVLPMVWVARRRYTLYAGLGSGGLKGFYSVLTTWAAFFLLHLDVFWPASLATLRNINYMMVPPPGPLYTFGLLYRPVMAVACILLGLISRDVIIAAVVQVAGLRQDAAGEAKRLSELEAGWVSASPSSTPPSDEPTGKSSAVPSLVPQAGPKARTSLSLKTANTAKSTNSSSSLSTEEIASSPIAAGAAASSAARAGSPVESAQSPTGSASSSTTTGSRGRSTTPSIVARLTSDTVSSAAKKRTPSPAAPSARRRSLAARE